MYPEIRSLISLNELTNRNRHQHEYTKVDVKELLGDENNQMVLNFTRNQFVSEQPHKSKGMSISGYQPKLSLALNEAHCLDVVSENGEYILKPSPEEFPNLSENEHATMSVMKALGFPVPAMGLTRFKSVDGNGEMAFIIRRFDRDELGVKIHQEQMDSAMGVGDKYGKTSDDDEQYVSYERIGQFIIKNVSSALTVKRDFFKRVLVALLLGNNDLHLRNFGLLHMPASKYELSPIYDYVSVAPYKSYITLESSLALPLLLEQEGGKQCYGQEKYSTYCRADFIKFGEGIGLNGKLVEREIDSMLQQVDKIKKIYSNSFVSENQTYEIFNWIDTMRYYLQKN